MLHESRSLAAFVLYGDEFTEQEKQNVRDYFDNVYDFKDTSTDGPF